MGGATSFDQGPLLNSQSTSQICPSAPNMHGGLGGRTILPPLSTKIEPSTSSNPSSLAGTPMGGGGRASFAEVL